MTSPDLTRATASPTDTISVTVPDRRKRRPSRLHGSLWIAFGFAAPLIAYLLIFYAYPLIRSIDLSIHDYTIRAFVQGNAEFVGLANYVEILQSPLFVVALWNTAVFVIVSIVFQYALGLALAVFFRSNFPLSGILRALFLVPWLLRSSCRRRPGPGC